jgi:hypothetical protein
MLPIRTPSSETIRFVRSSPSEGELRAERYSYLEFDKLHFGVVICSVAVGTLLLMIWLG